LEHRARKILLIEPAYKAKYPPLGLMKISTYHKMRGDHVTFARGCVPELQMQEWDRVYVSSLFTYYWSETVKTIRYYQSVVRHPSDVVVGGALATLMADELEAETGATVVSGLLNKAGMLDPEDNAIVDAMVPDYGILETCNYQYDLKDSYIAYATRGCPRTCSFCAVRQLEPDYVDYVPLKRQVRLIEQLYGPKRNLVLLDNNVLASDRFEEIIEDIKVLGFERGARYTYTSQSGKVTTVERYVDFNQGLDARLLSEDRMAMLSEIALRPVRIAFDDIKLRELYESKVRLAARFGMKYLSNYVLYNYKDHPDELYERLLINVTLNEELGLEIFSFPMRYIDLRSKDRCTSTPGNVGPQWNPKYLRAVQCILIRTRGLVGTKKDYFEEAFGSDLDDYHKILIMPEDYIVQRRNHEADGSTDRWWRQVCELCGSERDLFYKMVLSNQFQSVPYAELPRRVRDVLTHYLIRDGKRKRSSCECPLSLGGEGTL
jgi:hypothetical protein